MAAKELAARAASERVSDSTSLGETVMGCPLVEMRAANCEPETRCSLLKHAIDQLHLLVADDESLCDGPQLDPPSCLDRCHYSIQVADSYAKPRAARSRKTAVLS